MLLTPTHWSMRIVVLPPQTPFAPSHELHVIPRPEADTVQFLQEDVNEMSGE